MQIASVYVCVRVSKCLYVLNIVIFSTHIEKIVWLFDNFVVNVYCCMFLPQCMLQKNCCIGKYYKETLNAMPTFLCKDIDLKNENKR